MYKKILKNINSKDKHPVTDRKSHTIFSAEEPRFNRSSKMSHDDVMTLLKRKGLKVEEANGKYGGKKEKLIIVRNPSVKDNHFLKRLARKLGQESILTSNGRDHKLHYLNGENEGNYSEGRGSKFHEEEPEDNYTSLSDGSYFTHNMDLDKVHKVKGYDHPLRKPKSGMNLIHYSPKKGLKIIDPNYKGNRLQDQASKQGKPEHSNSFFYLEGSDPEDIVVSGSKSKYVVPLGDKKIYDIHNDWEGIVDEAIKNAHAKARQSGRNMAWPEEKDSAWKTALKSKGYSGYYSPHHDDNTMNNVVALFDPVVPKSEHSIHQNDYHEASAKDFGDKVEKSMTIEDVWSSSSEKEKTKDLIKERMKKRGKRRVKPYPFLDMITKGNINV